MVNKATLIRIKEDTKSSLDKIGKKTDSYDDIIRRLLLLSRIKTSK